jgi:hypothetical protein
LQFSAGPGWRRAEGLGRHGALLAATGVGGEAAAVVALPEGRWRAVVDLLPTYADRDGDPLALTARIDGQVQALAVKRETGSRDWAMGVLDNRLTVALPGEIAGGRHRIGLAARDRGVMIEAVRFVPVGMEQALH